MNKTYTCLTGSTSTTFKCSCAKRKAKTKEKFKQIKCKVNEPQAELKHRCFYDYDVEALQRASRIFYDHSVRKVGIRQNKVLMNGKTIQTLLIVFKMNSRGVAYKCERLKNFFCCCKAWKIVQKKTK